jgi:hypothetical protein
VAEVVPLHHPHRLEAKASHLLHLGLAQDRLRRQQVNLNATLLYQWNKVFNKIIV